MANAKSAVEALLDGVTPPAPAAAPVDDFKPPLPKTKGEVGKLSTEQLDMLVEAHGLTVPGDWHDASTAEKHKILNVVLGFVAAKGSKKAKPVNLLENVAVAANGEVVADPDPANVALLEGDEDAAVEAAGQQMAEAGLNQLMSKPAVADLDPNDQLVIAAQQIESLKTQDAIEEALKSRLSSTGLDRFYLGGL